MEEIANLEYPKAKYRADCEPIVVKNAEEDAALPEGWFDNPNDVHSLPKKRGPGRPPKVSE